MANGSEVPISTLHKQATNILPQLGASGCPILSSSLRGRGTSPYPSQVVLELELSYVVEKGWYCIFGGVGAVTQPLIHR